MTAPLPEQIPREPNEKSEGDVKQRGEDQRTEDAHSLANMLWNFPFLSVLGNRGRFGRGGCGRFCAFRAHAFSLSSAEPCPRFIQDSSGHLLDSHNNKLDLHSKEELPGRKRKGFRCVSKRIRIA
jgi:hypothetical protein